MDNTLLQVVVDVWIPNVLVFCQYTLLITMSMQSCIIIITLQTVLHHSEYMVDIKDVAIIDHLTLLINQVLTIYND